MLAEGIRYFAQYRLNPNNFDGYLPNGWSGSLRHIVVGDDLEGVTNMVV